VDNVPVKPKGAGLLLFHEGLTVFGLKRTVVENDTVSLELTGIGGKVEPGESFEECAVRECIEETGVSSEIVLSAKAWVMTEGMTPEAGLSADGSLITVHKRTPGYPLDLEIRVFAARLGTPPKPIEKMRHLFFMPLRLLKEIALGQMTVGDLLKKGVRIESAAGEEVPEGGVVTFIDSPGGYARYVEGALLEYVEGLVAKEPC
jgi:8-oxo-dGTP pyrophosphatase MutT (NUDIX family)